MSAPRTEKFIDSCGDYEKWHSYRDRLHDFARSLERETEALKAEVESLRKDAERYRWLCDQDDGSDIQILNIGKWVKPAMCIALTFQEGKERIDAYIDTAMRDKN